MKLACGVYIVEAILIGCLINIWWFLTLTNFDETGSKNTNMNHASDWFSTFLSPCPCIKKLYNINEITLYKHALNANVYLCLGLRILHVRWINNKQYSEYHICEINKKQKLNWCDLENCFKQGSALTY